MTRRAQAVLAVLAALMCLWGIVLADPWRIVTAGTCAVVFGLEAAGIETLGRTRRVLRQRRDRDDAGGS